ncbi:hypothetical protein DB347_20035 [Opitutaceae bacterium EW11]|nr:hypothetical protein DB347_20035 [Opitutaceae bacterium EW11]
MTRLLSRAFAFLAAVLAMQGAGLAAEWQWSVPLDNGRAFLWVPPDCTRVRAVIVGQNNMIEEGILEHPTMRRTLAKLGIAEVFVSPPFDPVFRFDQGASERFARMLAALSQESGYSEIAAAPVIPIGHSACASYPWNFAADNPQRTLAVLSVKGDAPQTDLTGSGKPNPDWGNRSIDGIPGLMVMSEYEWWDARLAPAMKFRAEHPGAPIALFADVGHGHFDAQDSLVEYLALFIRKVAEIRLPNMRPVDPAEGWLVDRWRRDDPLQTASAPAATYAGNRSEAFWCFDEEMARITEASYATSRGKKKQQVDFVQADDLAPIASTHAGVHLKLPPLADAVTFKLRGDFIVPLQPRPPLAAKDKAPPITTVVPQVAGADTHAPGRVRVLRITGPVIQLDEETFRIALNRTASTNDSRGNSIWLLATHPGDARFKGAVQQALLELPKHIDGETPRLEFAEIRNQPLGTKSVRLCARSDHPGIPVQFYVREGPAEIDGDTLRITSIPPRARFPVKITVVAWQFGRDSEPKLKDAEPVVRTFSIVR